MLLAWAAALSVLASAHGAGPEPTPSPWVVPMSPRHRLLCTNECFKCMKEGVSGMAFGGDMSYRVPYMCLDEDTTSPTGWTCAGPADQNGNKLSVTSSDVSAAVDWYRKDAPRSWTAEDNTEEELREWTEAGWHDTKCTKYETKNDKFEKQKARAAEKKRKREEAKQAKHDAANAHKSKEELAEEEAAEKNAGAEARLAHKSALEARDAKSKANAARQKAGWRDQLRHRERQRDKIAATEVRLNELRNGAKPQDSTEKQWVQDLEISRRQNPHIPRSTGEYEDEKDEL